MTPPSAHSTSAPGRMRLVGGTPSEAMIPLPIVDRFSAYLLNERHFSQYTARCYGADLRQYIEHLVKSTGVQVDDAIERQAMERRIASPASTASGTITDSICAATPDVIREFLAHLGTFQYSGATMARKIATLRSFYKWAARHNLSTSNPMTANELF